MTTPETPIDYRPFLELSPDMACVLELDGRLRASNAAWAAGLGIPRDTAPARSFVELAAPRDRERVAKTLARVAAGHPVTGACHRFLHHDGSPRWLSWSAAARPEAGLIFASARQAGSGGVNQRQLLAIAEGTTDFVAVAELDGTITYINPAGLAMVGRSGERVDNLHISDCRTEKGARHWAEVIRPTAERDGLWAGETEFRGPGSKPVPASQVFLLLRDDSGTPEGFGSIARDIGERRRRELELRRFKTIVDNTSDFVAISSPAGKLHYINAAGLALLGRSGEDPCTLDLVSVITPASVLRFEREIRSTLIAGRTWSGDPDLLCADGSSIPTATVVMALPGQDERPAELAIVARDLSSHRRADALQTAIRAMATPILEVWEGILAVPVIGVVDSTRAAEMTDTLLHAIVRTHCRVAILDLTGVEVMDTSTLAHLFAMVNAAALLGSTCVLSGISPHIAHTITTLGLDMSSLRAFATLRNALAFALEDHTPRKPPGRRSPTA